MVQSHPIQVNVTKSKQIILPKMCNVTDYVTNYSFYNVIVICIHKWTTADFSQVRHHIEMSMDENKAVKDRLSVFAMARTV